MIRLDFVSNSSSASYIVYSALNQNDTFKEIARGCSVVKKHTTGQRRKLKI